MKLLTPELVYHNIKPIYSCDIQPKTDDFSRLATGGLDNAVRLWKVQFDVPETNDPLAIELVANLCRHEKEVNCVRWSPSGKTLASASSDGLIILWTKLDGQFDQNNDLNDGDVSLEAWTARFLRRHIQDVYDLSWSPDDQHIISGSIDNSAIMWKVSNARITMLRDHQQFVQGVAWDPLDKFVITQSADRSCRVYQTNSLNCIYKVWKSGEEKLFHDGSWKFFFRRLQFSPDGKLLITPAGLYIDQKENIDINPYLPSSYHNNAHCAHIFVRNNLSKVSVTIPTGVSPVIGVRFNPIKFTLRKSDQPVFKLPYRWLFCLVLETSILIFDTEQSVPLVKVSNIHCLTINDASWSPDGHCLVVCSTDGYCSYLFFDKGELGEPFVLTNNKLVYMRPMDFDDTSICNRGLKIISPEISTNIIDMALESTEILARDDNDECSSDSDRGAADTASRMIIAPPVVVDAVTPHNAAKRRLTFTTLTSNDNENIVEPVKDKKRRVSLTTLT